MVGKLHPACAAMTMHESDPLMRWGGAFAVHRGGTVLVIPHESRKAAEAWIDEHRLRGTEMTACSLAIVWWTPGVDEAKAFVDSVPKVVGIIEAEHFAPIDEDSAAALCKSGRLAAVHCRDLATRR